ncbi:MAG: sulfate ABC transporter permease subunit [Tepidisphaeraceae bacterium]
MSRSNQRFRLTPWLVGTVAVAYLLVIVGLPVAAIFKEAFADGWQAFVDALRDEETLHALKLTLIVCAIVVPLNTVFGLACAWVLARHRFRGIGLLATFTNLPLAIAPTIAGLLIVLVYSPTIGLLHGPVEHLQDEYGFKILFALPGLVLATLVVTLPIVAIEVLPSLEQLDPSEAQAARLLGATGWQTFRKVVLPAIRWSVLYGVVLCTAKAAGEFGAVSATSGRLIGETNTLTLHIERSYAEYDATKAFASSTLLTALAVGTIVLNVVLRRKSH